MPSDLDYFYESDFGKGNFTTFYNSLPSDELKEKFLNSVPSHPIRWEPPWVYQGYMGHIPMVKVEIVKNYRQIVDYKK
jgi:hypothetical protein